METKINNILDKYAEGENVSGVILASDSGLCYGKRGEASATKSGLLTAIIDQAAKLHPNSNAPVVILETADREVKITKYGSVTGAIYKKKRPFRK